MTFVLANIPQVSSFQNTSNAAKLNTRYPPEHSAVACFTLNYLFACFFWVHKSFHRILWSGIEKEKRRTFYHKSSFQRVFWSSKMKKIENIFLKKKRTDILRYFSLRWRQRVIFKSHLVFGLNHHGRREIFLSFSPLTSMECPKNLLVSLRSLVVDRASESVALQSSCDELGSPCSAVYIYRRKRRQLR